MSASGRIWLFIGFTWRPGRWVVCEGCRRLRRSQGGLDRMFYGLGVTKTARNAPPLFFSFGDVSATGRD